MAATNAAIQNSMQQLAATTRLGVNREEKDLPQLSEFVFPNQNPTANRLSDSYPALVPRACTLNTVLA